MQSVRALGSWSGRGLQGSFPLALNVVTRDCPSERESAIVVEAIMDPSLEPGHRLLFCHAVELGSLLRKEVSERRLERAGAAGVA